MTRSNDSGSKPVSHKRRNLLAILIAFAAVSVLYFNFDPTPAGSEAQASGAASSLSWLTPMWDWLELSWSKYIIYERM